MKAPGRRLAAELRRAAAPGGRAELGCTVAEGTRLLERALRAGTDVRAVLVARSLRDDPPARVGALLQALAERDVPVHDAADQELEDLCEGRDLGRLQGLVTLPAELSLAALARIPGPLLVAAGVRDPGNLGALARSAHALGASALLTADATEVFHPRALQTSRGSLFKLPVRQHASSTRLLEQLAAADIRSVGAVASGGVTLAQAALEARPIALWVGGESHGFPTGLAERLDERVTIPMAPGVDSLSVHVAAALLVHETHNRGCDAARHAPSGGV